MDAVIKSEETRNPQKDNLGEFFILKKIICEHCGGEGCEDCFGHPLYECVALNEIKF